MEKIIRNTYVAERVIHELEYLFVAKSSGILFTIYSKLKSGLSVLKDFVECPSFCEGEITDTSGFETKILQINKLRRPI